MEFDPLNGLRQVNATRGALAAYRFNGRPFTLALKLKRIEPVIAVADRVTARLEETRLLISHGLTLKVEKAGIYAVELLPQAGSVVADVRGDGVEDWKVGEGKLRVNFSARVLGVRTFDVQLEQAHKSFPHHIAVAPLRVAGAAEETAQIGAAPAPGITLKTAERGGLREIPVRRLHRRTGVAPVSTTVAPANPDAQATGRAVPLSEGRAKRGNKPVFVWTVNDQRRIWKMLHDESIDAIITDKPEVAISLRQKMHSRT